MPCEKYCVAVLVVHEDGDKAAAQDAERVGENGEKKSIGDAGKEARSDQLAHGINAQSAHGVNLLRHDHRSKFAGHG